MGHGGEGVEGGEISEEKTERQKEKRKGSTCEPRLRALQWP